MRKAAWSWRLEAWGCFQLGGVKLNSASLYLYLFVACVLVASTCLIPSRSTPGPPWRIVSWLALVAACYPLFWLNPFGAFGPATTTPSPTTWIRRFGGNSLTKCSNHAYVLSATPTTIELSYGHLRVQRRRGWRSRFPLRSIPLPSNIFLPSIELWNRGTPYLLLSKKNCPVQYIKIPTRHARQAKTITICFYWLQ